MRIPSIILVAGLLMGTAAVAGADDSHLSSVTVSPQVGTLTYGAGGTATYTVTLTRRSGASGAFSAVLSQTASLPAGAAVVSFVPSTVAFASGDVTKTSTLTMSTASSTRAGSTTIKVKAKESDNSVTGNGTLAIDKAPLMVTANDDSRVYNGQTYSGGNGVTYSGFVNGETPAVLGGTLTYNAHGAKNAGSYAITPGGLTSSNYAITFVNGTLTIDPAAATVKANNKSKTYGSANPTLDATVTGEVPGGDHINYTLATTATQFSSVAGGPYPITVTLGANPNYSVKIPADNGTLTILARAATVTANNKSKTYGDLNPVLDATVTEEVPGGDAILYTLATGATQFSNVTGSPYAITVTLGANSNYSVTPTNGTLTINTAVATVTANSKSKTYGDPNPALDATVTGQVTGGALLNYTLTTPATQFSNVSGSPYAITVALGANPNYSVTSANGTLTIALAIATVTANNKIKAYGATNPALDATVTGQVPGGDVIAYTLATTATQFSNVADGPFPIAVTLGANPNYSITPANGTLTINAAIATVRANDKSKTYGDVNPALDATVTGAVSGGDAINFTLATTVTQFTNVAGSPYAITVTLGANPNYSVTPINGTLAIARAVATVTANNKSKAYGELNPALNATVTGQVPGGDVINYTLTTPVTQFTNVLGGPYAIIVTLGANPNYSVTPINGTLTINPAPASVIAISRTKVYGDPNPALEATVTGQVAGGAVIVYTLATTATQLSNVGTYPITVALGANPNYSIVVTNGTLTVQLKTATVRANDKAKPYGQPNPPLDATVGGQVANGDAVNYTLTTTATQFSGVGGYTITVTQGANPNYTVLTANGTLTINAAVATVQANDKSKIYGETNPQLDATVTGQVTGGDVIAYTLATTAAQYSNVADGPYPITVIMGSNPNYRIKPTNGTLTIQRAVATVTANNKTKTYGEQNPVLDATVTGEVTEAEAINRSRLLTVGMVTGGDPIHYTLSTTATQFSNVAGSLYPITVTLGLNPNYDVTPTNGTLAINPAIATVKANSQKRTYGEVNPTLDATVTGQVTGGDPIIYSLSTAATQFSNVAGSPYPIAVTLGGNPNYSVKVPADNGTLTINPASATVTADNKRKTYGSDNPPLTATVTGQVPGGDAIIYSLATTATKFSNVATIPYPITVTPGSNPNYNVTPVNGALSVDPAFATVKANSKTKLYGAPIPTLDATVTGQVAGGDPVVYSLSTAATALSPVAGSPYAINVTLGSNPNYSVKVPADNGTLTINPAPATVTANNKTKTYGANNPTLDATVAGAVTGGDAINYSLATAVTKCSPVAGGPYAIIVTLGVNPNYNVTAVNGAFTIDPAIAIVRANCKTKTYGSPNPPLDATVTGQVTGCDPILYTLGTAATQFSNVGTYPITVTLHANPNYSVKVPADNCALTITPALATVTANDKTKIYGAVVTTLDAVVTGQVIGGDPIVYTLTSPVAQFSNVSGSPYTITVTLGANPNYSIVATNGKFTINPANATVTADNRTKAYGAPFTPLIATVTGEVTGGDPIVYTVTSPVTQFSNVSGSPYTITVTSGANPNYNVVATNGTFTIDPAIASVKANNQTKTYGSVNPTPTATVTGEVTGGDRINYILAHTATQFSDVAGSPYPITVTLGSNPNYSVKVPADNGALTILPAIVTVTANNKTKTYGSPNPALDATVVGAVIGGAPLSYDLATAVVDCSPVAGSPYPITVTPGANPNYSVTPINGTLTINPAIVTVKANSKSRFYGAENPTLDAVVVGGVPGCDPVNFTLATAATQCTPVVGSPYPITVTLGANPNYSVKVPADNGTLTILPAPATVTANNKTRAYGSPNPVLAATVLGQVTGCDPIIYTLSVSATQFANVAGSPYAIIVTLGFNPNYNITTTNGTLTITPATATVRANNVTKFYGDPNPTLDVTITGQVAGGDPIIYTLATTVGNCSPVGTYPLPITLGSNPNYIVTLISGTLTILCRPVTVNVNDKTKIYGGANPTLNVTVTNEAVGCDRVNYTLATTATQFSNVAGSPYPITVTLGANPNYCVTVINGTLTIQRAPVAMTVNNKAKTYGDPNPPLDVIVAGAVTEGDAVKYSVASFSSVPGGDPINYTLTTTATQCSPLSGNPYPITATPGSNPNYNVIVTNGTLTINARPVTVKANDKTRTYGDPNPTLDATVTNAAVGCDPVDYDLTTTAMQFSSVAGSPYEIAVTLGANPNYSIIPTDGALAIQTRPVTVTASARTKVYGDPDPALIYTITSGSLAGTDAFSGELTRVAGQSVAGPYAINQGTLSLGDNYVLTYAGASLTITPATLAVTAGHQIKVYGNDDPTLSYTVTGFKFTDDAAGVLTGGLTRATGQTVAGSPYAILRGTLSSNSNYAIGFTGNSLEITGRPVTITASARTKVFGSGDPALTYAITDGSLAYTDAFTGTLSRANGESVAGGPYAILQNTLALNSSYALSYVGADLTITRAPAAPTLTVSPNPQQYSDFVLFTATVANGFLGGQQAMDAVTVRVGTIVLGTIPLAPSGTSLTGTLSVALLEPSLNGPGLRAPGSYTVTGAEPFANPNFAVTPLDAATLVIVPEDARATYSGAILASTTGGNDHSSSATIASSSSSRNNSGKATVTLSATIRDITATSDAAGDVSFGDIRNATITFVDRDHANAVIASVPADLVSSGETMIATATYDWAVDIGSASSKQFRVGIVVGGYYTRNSPDDNAVVTVAKPVVSTVTGNGCLTLSSSSGILAGGAGTRNDFSFNLKYKNNGTLQGSFSTVVRSGSRVYQVDAGNVSSLAVQVSTAGGTATLNGKASIRDITNPNAPTTVDNNATLQVTMADLGQPGTSDAIAITIWNKKGGLWFASNWDGVRTLQQTLACGDVSVSGGKGGNGSQPTSASQPTAASAEFADRAVPLVYAFPQNFPNPFTASTTLRFELPEPSRVTLTIYDVTGREVANLVDDAVDPGVHVKTWSGRNRDGVPAGAGVYFARIVATSLRGSGGLRSDRRIILVR